MEWQTPPSDDADNNWVPWVITGFVVIMVMAGLLDSCKGG